MRRLFTAALCGMLFLCSLIPAAAANDIFALLETPEPSCEPTPSNAGSIRPNTEAQDIFAALETPEPTPFPTPAPRIDLKRSVKSGDFIFELLPDKSARILAYNGKDKTLCIPSELESYPVTSIGTSAFANSASMTELEIPEGVTSIGDWSFGGCQNLMKVTLPEGLTTIGNFAFAACPVLSVIHIPSSVEEIGEGLLERVQPGEVLTIEVCKGSYAEQYFQNLSYNLSFYTPATPSPTPTTKPIPFPSYTNPPTPTDRPSYIGPYNPYDIENDCPTCLGIGGCPDCLYGDVDCPDCVGGRCSECGSRDGKIRSYDYAHHDVKKTDCWKCGGSGKCSTCGGTGRIPCPRCGGTGRCLTCGK